MEDLLRNALLTLLEAPDTTLIDLLRLVRSPAYRAMMIAKVSDESNPGALLRQCLAGKYYASYEGTDIIDGVMVSKVGIGRTREELALYYWMDVSRGCLPIRIESRVPKSGLVRYLAIVKDVRKCSNSRWFPVSSVVVDQPYRKEGPLRAREFHVKSLEVDRPPKKEAFELTVPAGTQISEPDIGNAFFTLKQEERLRQCSIWPHPVVTN